MAGIDEAAATGNGLVRGGIAAGSGGIASENSGWGVRGGSAAAIREERQLGTGGAAADATAAGGGACRCHGEEGVSLEVCLASSGLGCQQVPAGGEYVSPQSREVELSN